VFGFGSAAEQDANTHSVRHLLQQCLAGIQAMARLIEGALAGLR
jgi:hypothetical protein